MDEVSSYVRLDLLSARRQGRPKDCSTSSSNPMMEGPWCRFRREARARERHRHRSRGQSDVLDPGRPIREADMKENGAEPSPTAIPHATKADACVNAQVRTCDTGGGFV